MKKYFLLGLVIVGRHSLAQQTPNNNPEKSYINIVMPKTPESQAFERYGDIPADEFSGSANISIPLYTVKSKSLEVPLALSYQPGIRVNQEASWVGLGFDLSIGGRITVETKGNVDGYGPATTAAFKEGLQRIFNKWSVPYRENWNRPLMGYAFLDYGKDYNETDPSFHTNDTAWDDNYTISRSAWYGMGEPDIYSATFGGNSCKFYIDLISGEVKFIGEKKFFKVTITRNSGDITGISIIDNNGIEYIFDVREITGNSLPGYIDVYSNPSSVTAWLLTKIIHPDGDVIDFSYTNYGTIYPAINYSASISMSLPNNNYGASSPNPQNEVRQYPYYLTKIETNSAVIQFNVGNRTDLRGDGAKRLESIDIKVKATNVLVKQIQFQYDYFTASPIQSLPDYRTKRLKLLSVKDSADNTSPWSFTYNEQPGPEKLSFSVDHWGYFNGADNPSLIPTFADLGNLATRNTGDNLYTDDDGTGCGIILYPNAVIPENFEGSALSRKCNPEKMLLYNLAAITYPTGGKSVFEFEPHISNYVGKGITDFVGGGLRIKNITNYAIGDKISNITSYDYLNSGIYLGSLVYIKIAS